MPWRECLHRGVRRFSIYAAMLGNAIAAAFEDFHAQAALKLLTNGFSNAWPWKVVTIALLEQLHPA